MFDALNQLARAVLSAPAAKTSTVTGTGVSIADYGGRIVVVQDVGVVSGTSPTLDGKLQDSADDSTYTDITGATFTQATATTDNQAIALDTRAVKKYVRYVGTIAGTTPVFNVAVTLTGQKATI